MEITTRMEFDAGHRIPGHKSTCKNLHGHRYAIEVTIKGDIVEQEQASEFGMVMDFKDAKDLIKRTIVDRWDHAFIVYENDHEVVEFLKTIKDHKTVIFPKVPTAENMALVAFESLKGDFKEKYNQSIVPIKVRLYETPNNWADVS
ncbi:6-carboxytetrahydropterin synthase QueD [Methylophilaceae bacterium]|jgi:6-pyruvoyltetrahydropterin/6-carboxytetrahydropterin synthase|nr:6-carboxytetrahydropterin synthase QueD [Methylophilaceae bacterium]